MPSGAFDRKRKRGVVLTSQGIQKLRAAITALENEENFGQKLTIAELGFRTRLAPDTVTKVLNAEQGVDHRTLYRFLRTLNLELCESDFSRADLRPVHVPSKFQVSVTTVDLGEAPDVAIFYGRTQELEILTQWIQIDRCRVINLLGMGGTGKTALVAKLIKHLNNSQNSTTTGFKYIIWRSLRHAPPVEETLTGLLRLLTNQPDLELLGSLNQAISQLMQMLQQSHCLLVIDNLETILQPKERSGCYQPGFEGYGELIRRIGESPHNSCLILTSREQLHEIRLLEGKAYPVRSHSLKGLLPQDGLKILQAEGLDITNADWQILFDQYAGNPLLLKILANTIQLLFLGEVTHFLAQGAPTFGSIYDLLEQQIERLSDQEKIVITWLANHRKPAYLSDLTQVFLADISRHKLLGILETLKGRSLLECTPTGFTVLPVVIDYVTSQLIAPTLEKPKHDTYNINKKSS